MTDGGKKVLFPDHLTSAQIQSGIKSGRYKQGAFQASRENYREAYINVHGEEKQVSVRAQLFSLFTPFPLFSLFFLFNICFYLFLFYFVFFFTFLCVSFAVRVNLYNSAT